MAVLRDELMLLLSATLHYSVYLDFVSNSITSRRFTFFLMINQTRPVLLMAFFFVLIAYGRVGFSFCPPLPQLLLFPRKNNNNVSINNTRTHSLTHSLIIIIIIISVLSVLSLIFCPFSDPPFASLLFCACHFC
jgi:hypothetical protein